MDYAQFCRLLDRLKDHLLDGQDLSMAELLKRAQYHERLRNFTVWYAFRSPEHMHIFQRMVMEDRNVYQLLLDLNTALQVPRHPSLRSLTRMLRSLPFYQRTDAEWRQLPHRITMASCQMAKLLLSMERLYLRERREMTPAKRQYIAERKEQIRLVSRSKQLT